MNIETADSYFSNLPTCIKKDWLPQRVSNLGWNYVGEKSSPGWLSVLGEDPNVWRERIWTKTEIDLKDLVLSKASEKTARDLLLTVHDLPPNEKWKDHKCHGLDKLAKIKDYVIREKKFPSYIFGNVNTDGIFLVDGYHRYTLFRTFQRNGELDEISTLATFYSGEIKKPNKSVVTTPGAAAPSA